MTEPIARIEAALARLGEEHEPPAGWEARVLAAAALQQPQRRWWWITVPAMVLAAAAVVLLVVLRPPRPPQLALNIVVEQTAERAVERGVESSVDQATGRQPLGVVRKSNARQNQTIHATTSDGGPERALWIYRNEKLIIRCPGSAECRAADEAVFKLELTGVYQVVALSSRSPLPAIAIGALFDPTIAQLPGEVVRQRHEITVR